MLIAGAHLQLEKRWTQVMARRVTKTKGRVMNVFEVLDHSTLHQQGLQV
jgi:hypothetical protein